MARPELQTLRLLRDVIEDIASSPALSKGGTLFGVKWEVVPDGAWSAKEPGRRDLRDLLDRLRQLDMPSSDVRLERVYPILAAHVLPESRDELETARAAYED
jgi:hypothetical protein